MYEIRRYDILNKETGHSFPKDFTNSEYTEYVSWLKSGGTPDIKKYDYEPPASVPSHKIKILLSIRGLQISSLDPLDNVSFQTAPYIHLNSLIVEKLRKALGWTLEERDEFFRDADSIET